MKSTLFFLLLLSPACLFGQFDKTFTTLPVTDTIPPQLHQVFKLRLEKDKAAVMAKGKVGNYMKSLYEKRFELLVDIFNKDFIILNDDLSGYLQHTLNTIYAANPQLPRETTIFTYRSETPNAMSFGEGTLCFMLGLLARMETEDQVAFVLCHELAHYHAKHAERKVSQLAEANYDKALKKKIDAIMASPYGRYTQLKELFSALDFSLSKHSRSTEFEADSLGLVYYLNTPYNRFAPLQVMQILDNADNSAFTDNLDFRKYFNFKAYPFKDPWASYTKSDVWHAPPKYAGSDTARTHPQCLKRFDALQRQLKITDLPSGWERKGKSIESIRLRATFEIVNTHYHFKQYGKALFAAMVLAETYPDNAYLHAMIGKSLYQLYQAQKNHALGKVLELPDPRFEENYDRFLTFIHKLRLMDLAHLAYNYMTTRPERFYTDEEFLHSLWMCSRLDISQVDPEKVKDDYIARYPDGKYIKEMNKY